MTKENKRPAISARLSEKLHLPSYFFNMVITILAVQWGVYYGARLINTNRPHYNIEVPLDGMIPLIPWTIFIYVGAFAFWVVNFFIVLTSDRQSARRITIADLLSKGVCFIIFLIMPTLMNRPEATADGLAGVVLRYIYSVDTPPDNLFPSLHCVMSWICFLGVKKNARVPVWYRWFSMLFALAICVSTMTVKQHVFVDTFTGILVGELCYFVAGLITKRDGKKAKKIDNVTAE